MVGVMHASDADGECWDKEKCAGNVLEEVARCEDVEDRSTNIDEPGKEDEVPELAACSCALNNEVLLKGGHVHIDK